MAALATRSTPPLSTLKTPCALPPVMEKERPAPTASSGSEATIAAPTALPTVVFSSSERLKSCCDTPGCGENVALKTGGSLRLFSATVTFASAQRPKGSDTLTSST